MVYMMSIFLELKIKVGLRRNFWSGQEFLGFHANDFERKVYPFVRKNRRVLAEGPY